MRANESRIDKEDCLTQQFDNVTQFTVSVCQHHCQLNVGPG